MSYFLGLVVAATVLGATQASSEEVGIGEGVRWVDNDVTVGTSLNGQHGRDQRRRIGTTRDDGNY
jgi:hypothetical protein